MNISALANVFNSVYIQVWTVLRCGCSQFRYGVRTGLYERKLRFGAAFCEFFAGVAPPNFVLKYD